MNLFLSLSAAFVVLCLLPQLAALVVYRAVNRRSIRWATVAAAAAAPGAFFLLATAASSMWMPGETVHSGDSTFWYEIQPQLPGGLLAHLLLAALIYGALLLRGRRA